MSGEVVNERSVQLFESRRPFVPLSNGMCHKIVPRTRDIELSTELAQQLGTNEFARCRVGIGRSEYQESVSYVLERPTKDQKPLLDSAVERARDAVFCWIECGIETAMSEFNRVSE